MSRSAWRSRLRSSFLAAVLVAHGVTAFALATRSTPAFRFAQVDFNTYWAAAALVAAGQDPYDGARTEALARSRGLSYITGSDYIYPPYLAAALSFAASLPPRILGFIWYLASLLCLAAALLLILLGQGFSFREAIPRWQEWLIFACLFAPVRHALWVGQVNAVLLLLIAAAYLALRRGSDATAGTLVGLAALLKVAPVLLAVHFVLARRTRALSAMLITLAAVPLLTLPWLGGDLQSWIVTVPARLSRPMAHPVNQSLNGFFSRLLTESAFTVPLRLAATGAVRAAVLIASAVCCAWVAARLAAARERLDRDADLSFGLLIALILVVSPLAWENLYLLLLFPLLALAHRRERLSRWPRAGLVLSVVLVSTQRLWDRFTNAPLEFPGLRNLSLLMSLGLYGALLLIHLQAAALTEPPQPR